MRALDAMRAIASLIIVIFISGCVVLAKNHYFKLANYESKTYDDFKDIWCFSSSSEIDLTVCSTSFASRSEAIGAVVPVVPQTDRESRLVYDISRSRLVEVKNTDLDNEINLHELLDIALCENKYSEECSIRTSVIIKPSSSVWLRIPPGESVVFSAKKGANVYKIHLEEFSERRTHLVSV